MNKYLETAGKVERMLAEASVLVAQSTVDLVKRCQEAEDEVIRIRAKWQEDYQLLDEVCRKANAQEKRLAAMEAKNA